MAAISSELRTRSDAPRFDPTPGRVRYSPRWLGASASLGMLSLLTMARGGLPAAAALGLAGVAGAVYATTIEPRNPELTRLTLEFANLPPALDGIRIGQLSDMHLGNPFSARNSRWAVERMHEERPDMIALTGDFVSYDHAIAELPAILAPLNAPLGMFAVPGNHDYWEGLNHIRRLLEPLGVEFLINHGKVIPVGDDALYVAGVDDLWDGHPDLDAALAERPAGMWSLLLAHAPDIADAAAAQGVELQLSGHTHGGHLCLPYLGSFCLPRHGWIYSNGHAQAGTMQVYVSRGLGGLPLRLGCRPEAIIFTLRRARYSREHNG
ncbi:MAG: metallophosphoesterase [Oscillochloris sp.]|nr:metallophosphoesterase [Oscillochloris sp.]